MEHCASAMLYWGFPIADNPEEEYEWSKDSASEEYAVRIGVRITEYPSYDDWRTAVIETKETCSCDVECGGYEYSEHCVVFKGSVVESFGGSKECVNLQVGENWEQQLKDYCEQLNIPWQTPKWYVNPSYG